MGLADARGDEVGEQGKDCGVAGRAPRGGPEGEERSAGGGGEGEVGGEGIWIADAVVWRGR